MALTLVSGGAHHGLVEDVLVRNVTLSKPYFEVRHLESGVRFEARVFTSNRKRSEHAGDFEGQHAQETRRKADGYCCFWIM